MKKILLIICGVIFAQIVSAQSNCSNPTVVSICPSVCRVGETNVGMGDDAPAPCNIAGEDVVYQINAPNGAQTIFLSIMNATGPLRTWVTPNTCGSGTCSSVAVGAGNTNLSLPVTYANVYYLWIDAPGSITYDICIGADTATGTVVIPNTRGNLNFDSTGCATPLFNPAKPFFQVKFNGVFKTNPMTMSPLFAAATFCINVFFKNTTGVEGIKQFNFHFNPAGFSGITAPASFPGFYNAGTWFSSVTGTDWTFTFVDAAGLGKGDFTGSPNTCLNYNFCFTLTPLSNSPTLTNVNVVAFSDGFGAGYSGPRHSACCPAPFPNCLGGAGSGIGAASAFGFGINDPGVGTLPIDLVEFLTKVEENRVRTSWVTASEQNNAYFTIEKSRDIEHWTSVGQVKGAGNSSMTLYYQLIDDAPFTGDSYYRLSQTDYDGTVSYSDIRKVNVHESKMFEVYPNPAHDKLIVRMLNASAADCALYNYLGEKVQATTDVHDNECVISTASLPNGMYFLLVNGITGDVKTERVVIQH